MHDIFRVFSTVPCNYSVLTVPFTVYHLAWSCPPTSFHPPGPPPYYSTFTCPLSLFLIFQTSNIFVLFLFSILRRSDPSSANWFGGCNNVLSLSPLPHLELLILSAWPVFFFCCSTFHPSLSSIESSTRHSIIFRRLYSFIPWWTLFIRWKYYARLCINHLQVVTVSVYQNTTVCRHSQLLQDWFQESTLPRSCHTRSCWERIINLCCFRQALY